MPILTRGRGTDILGIRDEILLTKKGNAYVYDYIPV